MRAGAGDDEKEPSTLQIDGTLDIETENWDRFVLAGVMLREPDATGQYTFKSFDWKKEEEYIDFLLAQVGTIWSYNGGRFDLLHICEHLRRRSIRNAKVHAAGQRITALEIGDLVLRDAMAIAGPMGLKDFAKIGRYEKSEIGLECTCGRCPEPRSGHCRTRVGMDASDIAKLREYNRYDCLSLLSALDELQNFCTVHRISLRGTIGASAFATASQMTTTDLRSPWRSSRGRSSKGYLDGDKRYEVARKSYYGGRTQVFRPTAQSGYRYDINSAYPAALINLSLPIGEPVEKIGPASKKAYERDTPGLYQVKVSVPEDTFIPPLPYRTKKRIAYPVGNFWGWWTIHELKYAESTGVWIQSFDRSLTFADSAPALADYCSHVYALRDQYRENKGLYRWLKNAGNCLSGKCAQRPEIVEITLGPEPVTICRENRPCGGKCSSLVGCCSHMCWGTCGSHIPLDKAGYVCAQKKYRIVDCANIHWAAYLTSYTRIELHKQLVSDGVGGRTAVYCDTDSCYSTTRRRYNLDERRSGAWKCEGTFAPRDGLPGFEAKAPKTYRYWDDEEGKFTARSKGIPDASKNWERLALGVPIDRGVLSFRSAVKSESGSLFQRKSFTRTVNPDGLTFGDRVLGSDGLTYPKNVREVE